MTLAGFIAIGGADTTLEHVNIDGSNTFYRHHPSGVACSAPASEPLDVEAPGTILQYDNYYQSVPSLRGNGIGIGFWADANNSIIRYDHIHDVGSCQAYDHLIYLSHGNNVRIYGNWLWNDPHGRGIQLYPAPTNARIWGNVIDHVGVGIGIGGDGFSVPRGNRIFDNVIMDATGLPWEHLSGSAINSWFGASGAHTNSFEHNAFYGMRGGLGPHHGMVVRDNVRTKPRFVDAMDHDYHVLPTPLIRRFLPRVLF